MQLRTRRQPRQTSRGNKLRAFGGPKTLQLAGFRSALYRLAKEFSENDEDEARDTFEDWFGKLGTIPAGYEIIARGDREGIWDYTIHVYEIENGSAILPRLLPYARIADGDGPHCCVHVFDRYGRERIIDQDQLAALSTVNLGLKARDESSRRFAREWCAEILKGDDPDADLGTKRTQKWKAAYDALREMGISV